MCFLLLRTAHSSVHWNILNNCTGMPDSLPTVMPRRSLSVGASILSPVSDTHPSTLQGCGLHAAPQSQHTKHPDGALHWEILSSWNSASPEPAPFWRHPKLSEYRGTLMPCHTRSSEATMQPCRLSDISFTSGLS